MGHSLQEVVNKTCERWQQKTRHVKIKFPDRDKTIQDPVHGAIHVERELLFLMDSIMVQRLRNVSQLALAKYVFPGANHSRFEHCLGVMCLVGKMVEKLKVNERLSSEVVIEAKAAGLLHDIGHIPFSHSLEPLLEMDHDVKSEASKLNVKPSELLTMSIIKSPCMREIFGTLNKNGRYSLDPDSIARMAVGQPPKRSPNNAFLGELSHGNFDADRMDYLVRDAHYTGVPLGTLDLGRLLQSVETRRSAGKKYLVVGSKGLHSLLSMIVARSTMYSAVYFHHGVRAANGMLLRAAY
jgi:HD superfamily phosphohydrolase